jgi:hypothetical protein
VEKRKILPLPGIEPLESVTTPTELSRFLICIGRQQLEILTIYGTVIIVYTICFNIPKDSSVCPYGAFHMILRINRDYFLKGRLLILKYF